MGNKNSVCIPQTVTRNCSHSCPDGLRDDGINCWEDVKTVCDGGVVTMNAPLTCNSNRSKNGELCYQKCRDGYNMNAGTCWNNKPLSIQIPESNKKSASCPDNQDLVAGLCYNKCPDNTSRVAGAPTQCQGPRGLNYKTKTAVPTIKSKKSEPATCKSNRELKDGLCYKKCNELYGDCWRANPNAVTECMPNNGISYNPKLADCPNGYSTDGNFCNNSYIPKTYEKKMVTAECNNNRDQINGSCYEKCPTITDQNSTLQLGHMDGIPTLCVPQRGNKHPIGYNPLILSYIPETYVKKRKVPMSTK